MYLIPLLLALLPASLPAQNRERPDRNPNRMDEAVRRAPQRNAAAETTTRSLRRLSNPRRPVKLGALTNAERRPAVRKPGLTPVGVARTVPADAFDKGEWSTTPEGTRVWRLQLQSADAESLRVKFADFHLGTGKIWLLGSGSTETIGPYTGDGVFNDGSFWSDLTAGDTLTIAYEPDPTDASSTIPFRIEELSHRYGATASARLAADEPVAVRAAAAATCAVDVTCHPNYSDPASAVALMLFESGGKSYQCSGALINSATDPVLPYFLTANHCVSTAEEAKSLVTLYRYQTPACNGLPPALSSLPRVTGATLLAGQPMASGDFTLLQLAGFPDTDVKLLGWLSDSLDTGESVIGISHPHGDFKRIAFGQRTRDYSIRFADGERMPASAGYQVAWTEGLTQGGSSGSPLLVTRDGKLYAAGTLTAGPDIDDTNSTLACRAQNTIASYGRFSVAFPYLQGYLTGGTVAAPEPATTATSTFTATPITYSRSRVYGQTTLTWQATGVTSVQVRVDSPTGVRVTGVVQPNGTLQTGNWVTIGTVFYLQDASDGSSSGASKTLATVRVVAP